MNFISHLKDNIFAVIANTSSIKLFDFRKRMFVGQVEQLGMISQIENKHFIVNISKEEELIVQNVWNKDKFTMRFVDTDNEDSLVWQNEFRMISSGKGEVKCVYFDTEVQLSVIKVSHTHL